MREELNEITGRVIGCAIRVHKALGPGLLESPCSEALAIEFVDDGLRHQRQVAIPALYKGRAIGHYRLDFIVEERVIVEVKSVSGLDPVFDAQMLTYLRASHLPLGLLINFNTSLLKNGVRRYVLTPND
jgi:GxxExxY protein